MNASTLALTGELAAEMHANDRDTRNVPVRCSHLKAFGRSPAHALYAMQHDYEPTLAMRIGSAVHSLILGGPPVVVYPGKVRRGKDWDAFELEHAGSIVVSQKEADRAAAMSASVRGNKLASQVLYCDGSIYEQTIHWEQNGRKRRSTPDNRTKSHVAELKTARDASPEKFRWDAIRMGYHVQVADQAEAMRYVNGYPPKDAYIIAVESAPPYLCTVHRLTTGALERGAGLAAEWLAGLIECEQSGVWPGYSSTVLDFDVPLEMDDFTFTDDETDTETKEH